MFKHRDDIITNRNRMFYGINTIREECFGYRNIFDKIKNIPRYIRRVRYLKKYGYDKGALWETFDWFTKTMRDILIQYRYHHNGSPLLDDNDEGDAIHDKWDAIVDRMIELLDLMDEDNPIYDIDFPDDEAGREEWLKITKENNEKMYAAKDEFFELFSKYFYHLWD